MGFFKRLGIALGLLKREAAILVVGLDNSGKSTILRVLTTTTTARQRGAAGGDLDVVPTVGFAQETFVAGKLKFTAFDMSGASNYRALWEVYLKSVQAIVFVVDASDRIRLCVAADELQGLAAHPDVKSNPRVPCLVFANKSDLPAALDASDVSMELRLETLLRDRPWHIAQSNALTGDGVEEGVAWLVGELTKR